MLDKIVVTFADGHIYTYYDSIVDAFALSTGAYDANDSALDDFWAGHHTALWGGLQEKHGAPITLEITQHYP